jgi:hypothetical protein
MAATLILCTGLLRSGSTWSFNVCRELGQATARRHRQGFGSAYLTEPQLDFFLNTQARSIPGPTVLKTHGVGPVAQEWIRTGRAAVVCTYRDPRDCVASMLTFFGLDFATAARRIHADLEFLALYETSRGLLIRYEEMMSHPLTQIERIATHLRIVVDRAELRRIDQVTNLQNSAKICRDLAGRDESQILRSGGHRVDPATSLHDNHIMNSKPGRWRSEFTDEQARTLTELFHPWLIRLGYEPADAAMPALAMSDATHTMQPQPPAV